MVHRMMEGRVLHLRFEGRGEDIAFARLGVNGHSTERHVRRAVARYLDVPERKLAPYVVEWHANGNVTLRPEAVFG